MVAALAIFGVTLAAFCAWLMVRIANRRERWAKWTLASVVGLPALYVLSFGPTCWAYSRHRDTWKTTEFIYAPLLWLWVYHDGIFPDAIEWYANLGSDIEVQAGREINAGRVGQSVSLVRIWTD